MTVLPTMSIQMPDTVPFDARRQARSLFWRGYGVSEISEEMGLKRTTVQSWKDRDGWDHDPAIIRIESSVEARLCVLIAKEKKSGSDFKEIDLLFRGLEKTARVQKYLQGDGHTGHLNEGIQARAEAPRKKAKRNHFTAEQAAELRRIFEAERYDYQIVWSENQHQRTRMIRKSRQIGATFYFAREALLSAVEEGRNKNWLSASKSQGFQARSYMVEFAARVGVTLTGEVLAITSELCEGSPPAEIRFLGTNMRTAQGYHGDFYFDEYAWVHGFEQLNKVASGMAMHKHWRKTYMSAPSSVAHESYPYWTGERRNRNRKKSEQIKIDVNHAALKDGRLCEDKVWRHIVTVVDAEAGGCDLFDIEELRDEYPPDEFANLLMCVDIDDSMSAFKFNELAKCLIDSWVAWEGFFKPLSARPVGNMAVWAGYDPQESEDGDNAALTIALPPQEPGGDFLILEKHQLRGMDFEEQSQFIRSVFTKYNVTYFALDKQGVGAGVYQLVKKWYPRVVALEYTIEVKARLVMKAQNVIARGRLKFDAGWTDVVMSFLAIKKTLTRGGGQITFKAGRSKDGGHADLAWSIMHFLDNEPLDGLPRNRGRAEILGGMDGDEG